MVMEAYTPCRWIYHDVHTLQVDTVIMFLHVTNTMMMSRGERKPDCLKKENKCETNLFGACVHAPQTNSLSRGVGEVNSMCV